MSGHPGEIDLNGFADGTLPEGERTAVAAHVAGCDACRTEVAQLTGLLLEARALPESVEPEHDLWPGIRDRVEAERVLQPDFRGASTRKGSWGRRLALATAAVGLMASSSALTLFLTRSSDDAPAVVPVATTNGGVEDGLRLVGDMERGYASTVEELETMLELRRSELQPATVAVIEENLRIIDRAIEEAGQALAQDPANVDLARTLSSAYRQKVELLGRAVRLPRRI